MKEITVYVKNLHPPKGEGCGIYIIASMLFAIAFILGEILLVLKELLEKLI